MQDDLVHPAMEGSAALGRRVFRSAAVFLHQLQALLHASPSFDQLAELAVYASII